MEIWQNNFLNIRKHIMSQSFLLFFLNNVLYLKKLQQNSFVFSNFIFKNMYYNFQS